MHLKLFFLGILLFLENILDEYQPFTLNLYNFTSLPMYVSYLPTATYNFLPEICNKIPSSAMFIHLFYLLISKTQKG